VQDQALSEDSVAPSVQFDPRKVQVSVSTLKRTLRGTLIDRGANGSILGSDAKVQFKHNSTIDVTGIDNHELNSLPIVDATAKTISQHGEIIVWLRQYAYYGLGRTLHSAPQLEGNKCIVDDRSYKAGGTQSIRTIEGYVLPIDIISGLPYLPLGPHTDHEYETLPHIDLTSNSPWDPRCLDSKISDTEDWYSNIQQPTDQLIDTPFDMQGNLRDRVPTSEGIQVRLPTDQDYIDDEKNELFSNFHSFSERALDMNRRCFTLEIEVPSIEVVSREGVKSTKTTPKFEELRPYFLYVSAEKVKRTFESTTQHASTVVSGAHLQQTMKSPFPMSNVRRRNEPVCTDTIFADVPAVDTNGQTCGQLFIGRKSLAAAVQGMRSKSEYPNALEDHIREWGAMDKIISDCAPEESEPRVQAILRAYMIEQWRSEPHYQHQNFCERRWGQIKRYTNWLMNWRNVPEDCWLLALEYVIDVMNHTAEESLKYRTPMEVLTGTTPDISKIPTFVFFDVVYTHRYKDKNFSGQIGSEGTSEIRGHFVGFSDGIGHALTFKVLTSDTRKIIYRSRVRLSKENENNLKLDTRAGEPSTVPQRAYIRSIKDQEGTDILPTMDISGDTIKFEYLKGLDEPTIMDDPPLKDRPFVETVEGEDIPEHLKVEQPGETLDSLLDPPREEEDNLLPHPPRDPDDMIDRSYLMPQSQDGSRVRAKVLEIVNEHKRTAIEHPELIKFRCLVNDQYEEVIAYNDLMDYIENDPTWEGAWNYKKIHKHEGPLKPGDPKRSGSSYNVLIEWETGEITWHPLQQIWHDNPDGRIRVDLALYAREQGLLGKPGWNFKEMKSLAKNQKKIIRRVKQAKLHSFRTKPVYMYGYLVPRNHSQAMDIDRANGNTKWKDAEKIELEQMGEYQSFDDRGIGYRPGAEFTKITVHFVYAVKHDGRHKARLVAGGHLTDTPIDSVYSSVVPLRGIRILTFIAELNGMDTWVTDIGNAYLESYTREKVFIIAGPEFGELEGHTLIIVKALYGLKSSGLMWHHRLEDVLRSMGFFLSKTETDIWMRDMGDHWEYIAVYVDDLMIISRDPKSIVETLEKEHCFKLKGTGPIEFHLGCDWFRDENGVLCYAPRQYIDKMIGTYERLYGTKPRKFHSPLIKGDHPELDTSDTLDDEGTKIYQSLVGALQWVIQIGRFDVMTAVMTLSRFRALPRQGHLDRVKRVYGYLYKWAGGTIRIRTEEPDYSDIPDREFDWERTCYLGASELIPDNIPRPMGKPVITTTYFDANLMHDLTSGRSVTGILHLLNKTPTEWYSKLQSTVETATFGSEGVAGRTATEHIMGLRMELRYLGVPIKGKAMAFGDNESMVNTSTIPHFKIKKRHNALSFHRVREAIAAGILKLVHIAGALNPADILSKHWDMPSVWPNLKPLMFWNGDTAELINEDPDDET